MLAGRSPGAVWGLDPGQTARFLWSAASAPAPPWAASVGHGADAQRLYVATPTSARLDEFAAKTGPAALQDRIKAWARPVSTPSTRPPARCGARRPRSPPAAMAATPAPASREPGACMPPKSGAPSTMPGVVFLGRPGTAGSALLTAATGKAVILGRQARLRNLRHRHRRQGPAGRQHRRMGPAIANGMVFTRSGFHGAANTGGTASPLSWLLGGTVSNRARARRMNP